MRSYVATAIVAWAMSACLAAADGKSVVAGAGLGLKFSDAEQIVVYHTPLNKMGQGGFDIVMAERDWRLKTVIRCSSACKYERHALIDQLAAARPTDIKCEGVFTTVVVFQGRDEQVYAKLGIHSTGRCFMLDGRAYFSEVDLIDLLEDNAPSTW